MRKFVLSVAAMLAVALMGAEAQFDLVPNAALKHLKGVRGKPIRTGVVFVEGRYLPPPYTVWRKGTAIYIGNVQVTGEVVPWRQFMVAQGDGIAQPVAKKPAAAPSAAAKNVEDLFDDEPAAKKKVETAAVPEGPFAPNDRTKRLLKRVNDYRTDVDRRLRRGEILFFGSRYAMLHVEDRLCMPLMTNLPKGLREARSSEEFQAFLRGKGIGYLGASLCEDLMRHQNMSFEIEGRLQKMKEEAELYKIIDAGAQGGVQ